MSKEFVKIELPRRKGNPWRRQGTGERKKTERLGEILMTHSFVPFLVNLLHSVGMSPQCIPVMDGSSNCRKEDNFIPPFLLKDNDWVFYEYIRLLDLSL